MKQRTWTHLHAGLLSAAASLGLLACAVFLDVDDRHSWWEERGPVVPHESFPGDCSLCHLGGEWSRIREDFEYDHARETGLELEGAHGKAECLLCHNDRGPVTLFSVRGCLGCHEDPHVGQMGKLCTDCHDQESWRPLGPVADHLTTRVPLVGAHAATACWSCHPGAASGDFANTDTSCEACHADELVPAMEPDHLAAGWISGCEACHAPTRWDGEGFLHDAFPLTQAHALTDCSACHSGSDFGGLSSACAACHMAEFDGASDPDHVALGFSTSCELCHPTTSWEDGRFDHALTALACADCHQADYDGTSAPDHAALSYPTDCVVCHTTKDWRGVAFDHSGIADGCLVCHQADYDGATEPDHAGLGFPTGCELCHATNTWEGAIFDHTGITDGCVVCHQADYDATNDPRHAASGFPTTCETCHTSNGWDGADFLHAFPIQNGPHVGLDCSDCHVVAMDFAAFSCIDCHEHNQSDMDDKHDDVGDYVYESNACLDCHPNGLEFGVREKRRVPVPKAKAKKKVGGREPLSMSTCPRSRDSRPSALERLRSIHSEEPVRFRPAGR